jgi:hypothetical protein
MHMERRNTARLAMRSQADILRGGMRIDGESENLSMDGAFVTAVKLLKVNDVVTFNICQTTIRAKARVVRVTDVGFALQFENTLLD